jgi:hypothetical protein
MRRIALLAAAFVPAATAQLTLFTLSPEQPAGEIVNIGAAPVGDVLAARLRLRNTGVSTVTVRAVVVSGTGFAHAGLPPLPYSLVPGAALDFEAHFQAAAAGSYSASLRAENASAILVASATPAPTISVAENGAWRLLASGMVIDFGEIQRGAEERRRFRFANAGGEALGPWPVSVGGDGFAAVEGAARTLTLGAGESVEFEVGCTPRAAGALEGVLAAGPRRFVLRATAVEPPLPRPEVSISLEEPRSARQGRLSVRLATPARGRAQGEVRLDFEPLPGLPGDSSVTFASGSRVAPFSVEPGDTAVRFGSSGHIDFQTGSTAGTLRFTLDAPGFREVTAVAIAPTPAAAISARGLRATNGLEVTLTGLDNTRSVGGLTFTFLGTKGETLPPGAFRVDAAEAFRQYFAGSSLGGLFLVRATFPVAGDAARIAAVDVEIINNVGSTRADRVYF